MNIVTRLADLERLLAEVSTNLDEDSTSIGSRHGVSEGQRLIDDLDHAQMLKATSYLDPSRHAVG